MKRPLFALLLVAGLSSAAFATPRDGSHGNNALNSDSSQQSHAAITVAEHKPVIRSGSHGNNDYAGVIRFTTLVA
ncbi:hypothetical protein [Pseudomonas sp. LRF_L74]|uniref:hypothetical protein n=1 Tax=Pseudomonas sp. LRF_L74 TaxID=3369422 RepID=UPI003F641056